MLIQEMVDIKVSWCTTTLDSRSSGLFVCRILRRLTIFVLSLLHQYTNLKKHDCSFATDKRGYIELLKSNIHVISLK